MPLPDDDQPRSPPAARRVRAALLALWLAASFGVAFFARDLGQALAGGWPLNFWLLAQGSVLVFIGIVMAYAWTMNRAEQARPAPPPAPEDPAP